MLVNSSVLDNEFFESDIPFELNAAALRHPMKWFSSNKRLFLPRYFSDSCLRYMLTFLAQYGRKWLEDSHTFMAKPEMENGLLTGNFLQLATLLASENSSNLPKHEKNWGRTWSRILKSREESMCYVTDEISEQLQMPFGFKSGKAIETDHEYSAWSSDDDRLRLFGISFKRYESKIKRLIDSLPPGLFEKDDPKGVEIIQNICSLDLENFLLFLQINPVEPLDTVKCTKLTSSVADDGGEHMETKEDCSMDGNVITSRSVPHPYVTATRAKTRNFVLLDEKIDSRFYREPSWFGTEFMLHLENMSAISYLFFISATRSEKIDWDAYLKQFRLYPSVSRFFETGNYKPKCLSQLYYWSRFRFPERTPPALGARPMNTFRPNTKGIKFIGFIMEIVRTRLAIWTASAQASELHRGSWTTEIPQEWSMAFRARSDLSILCRQFEEQKDVLHISIRPRERGLWSSRDDPEWTCSEQVLWECQKHILEVISDDEREYGPQNVELILLFLLGFPVLQARYFRSPIQIIPLAYPELIVEASLLGNSPNDVRIEMRIRTDRDDSRSESDDLTHCKQGVQFCWKDWIHKFEGCMKVLSMNFEWNDLKKRCTIEKPFALSSDEYTEGEGYSGTEDTWNSFEVMSESKSGESEHVEDQDNNRDGIEDRGDGGWGSNDKVGEEKRADMAHSLKDDDANCICAKARGKADENENGGKVASASAGSSECVTECEDQIWKKKENGGGDSESNEHTPDSNESERGGDDGSDLGVDAADRMDEPETMSSTSTSKSTRSASVPSYHVQRCACEYRLEQRAEKRIIEGTNEYYWHWEGWKPQPAFQRHPLLFELEGSDNESGTSGEEEDADDAESNLQARRREEAEEAASNEEGNEEESVVTLTDGEEMV
ncbi:hypothetical protein FGB62_10g16 [Gracilaria domingensis]|nr:hypothetical protein FGB62_10g16 [Gracilaria domingensis]